MSTTSSAPSRDGRAPEPGAIDLDGYLARIGYDGPREPTLAVLREVVWAQAVTVPFENLDPFFGWEVALDLPSLQRKLVEDGRGGYCFELNGLLQAALEQLGFEVTALAARVLWGRPEDAITARGHMLLRVRIDDEHHLVDVGFGGQTLTAPLRFVPDLEQSTPHEPYRLVERDGQLWQQTRLPDGWATTYRFDLQPQHRVDYEVVNYYLSTHPDSHFRTGLVAARPAPGRRYALRGRELTIHHLGRESERRTLSSPAELRACLERDLRIRVPEAADLDAAFARVTAASG